MITHEKISDLKPHPRNSEFFDDITGEKWEEFLKSVKTLGIIEPIIITPAKVIVSGHQRVRACKELGIDEIECVTKQYENEDAVLLDLIEMNIRQRGDVGGSAQKVGRRIKELERLYGVRNGSANPPEKPVTTMMDATENDIAEKFGMSASQLRRYKEMADMIPELSEAVDTGTVTQSAALAMMKKLSEDKQLELLSSLDVTKKYTQKETESLIAEITELKNQPPKIVERIPDDYKQIKKDFKESEAELNKARQTINGMRIDIQREHDDLVSRTAERDSLKNEIDKIKKSENENARKKHQIDTGAMFNARVTKFIEDVAGYVWLTDEINELPENDQKMFIRSIQKVKDWANQMEFNVKNTMEENK